MAGRIEDVKSEEIVSKKDLEFMNSRIEKDPSEIERIKRYSRSSLADRTWIKLLITDFVPSTKTGQPTNPAVQPATSGCAVMLWSFTPRLNLGLSKVLSATADRSAEEDKSAVVCRPLPIQEIFAASSLSVLDSSDWQEAINSKAAGVLDVPFAKSTESATKTAIRVPTFFAAVLK